MPQVRAWKTCVDFDHLPGAHCCESCHQDAEYGIGMCELYSETDGVLASVCCSMLRIIDALPRDDRIPK